MTCPCRRGSEGAGYGEVKIDAVCDICWPSEASGTRDLLHCQIASTTMMSSKAARFFSFADAKEFAKENHIALTARTYIGLKDFIDIDLHG